MRVSCEILEPKFLGKRHIAVGNFSRSQRCRGWSKWVQMTSAEGNSEMAIWQPLKHHALLCEVKYGLRARASSKESRMGVQAIAQGQDDQGVRVKEKEKMSSVSPFGLSLNADSDERIREWPPKTSIEVVRLFFLDVGMHSPNRWRRGTRNQESNYNV